jgi:hypothetical protein
MSRYFFTVPKDATWPPSKEEKTEPETEKKEGDNESAD